MSAEVVANPPALREVRCRSKLSIAELSRRSNVARSHISNIENGNRPASLRVICALAEGLGVSPYALLGPSDPKSAIRELVRIYKLRPKDVFGESQ